MRELRPLGAGVRKARHEPVRQQCSVDRWVSGRGARPLGADARELVMSLCDSDGRVDGGVGRGARPLGADVRELVVSDLKSELGPLSARVPRRCARSSRTTCRPPRIVAKLDPTAAVCDAGRARASWAACSARSRSSGYPDPAPAGCRGCRSPARRGGRSAGVRQRLRRADRSCAPRSRRRGEPRPAAILYPVPSFVYYKFPRSRAGSKRSRLPLTETSSSTRPR